MCLYWKNVLSFLPVLDGRRETMNKQPSMTSLTNLPHPNFLESTLSKTQRRPILNSFIQATKAADARHQSSSKLQSIFCRHWILLLPVLHRNLITYTMSTLIFAVMVVNFVWRHSWNASERQAKLHLWLWLLKRKELFLADFINIQCKTQFRATDMLVL